MQAVMAINTAKSKEKKEKRKKEKLAGLVNMQRDGDRWWVQMCALQMRDDLPEHKQT